MTSSSEALPARVIRAEDAAAPSLTALATPELRSGSWTRLGDSHVLGDAVTERALSGLAEQTRAAAQSQGYAIGWAEGRRAAAELAAEAELEAEDARRAAEERREAEHRAALAALVRAAQEFDRAATRFAGELEDQAMHLACELTVELVGHELRTTPLEETAADVVRRALAVLPTGVPSTLRLHPSVTAAPAVAELAEVGVQVVADAALQPLDAIVETPTGLVDLRIGAALERLREVLA
ncbi:hypothetical protein GCM10022215_07810 [Nocardioides fonticola]|uniref:Flagellar assembly protein FliH/Type III secretion system HrpE domain-containing protein n=1 Tax=Nocardioides fonticola TaxID=450363 RepID=A0ABP7XCT5_9ACTN